MILSFEVLVLVIWTVECVDVTYEYNQLNNKTKRTLSQHLLNYGDTKPILVYREAYVPPAFISDDYSNLKSEYKPTIPIALPEPVKFYHAQYPSQQRLPNLVPNSHINQLSIFNRDDQLGQYKRQPLTIAGTSQNFVPAESVVLPIEHKADVIMPHHISYPNTNVAYNLVPLRKYTHGGERVNYESNNSPHVPPHHPAYLNQFTYQPQVNTIPLFPNQYNSQFQRVQGVPPIVNYINRNYNPRKQNVNSPKYPYISNEHGRNTLAHKRPLQNNYSPLKAPLKKDENVEPQSEGEEPATKETRKIEGSNSEKKSISEDEENERESGFHKHPRDFEENDHFDYKDDTEEEYDQDNKKGSSKHVALKKNPSKDLRNGKGNLKNYYKFENSDYKQEHSKRRPLKNDKISKMTYKSINFSKEIDDTEGDSIEGKYSENIPITRKHRLLREKWYLTKNVDDIGKDN